MCLLFQGIVVLYVHVQVVFEALVLYMKFVEVFVNEV